MLPCLSGFLAGSGCLDGSGEQGGGACLDGSGCRGASPAGVMVPPTTGHDESGPARWESWGPSSNSLAKLAHFNTPKRHSQGAALSGRSADLNH